MLEEKQGDADHAGTREVVIGEVGEVPEEDLKLGKMEMEGGPDLRDEMRPVEELRELCAGFPGPFAVIEDEGKEGGAGVWGISVS